MRYFWQRFGDYYVRSLDSVNRTRKEPAMNFLFRFFTNVSPHPTLFPFFYIVYGHATYVLSLIRPWAKLLNKGVAFACIVHSSNNSTCLAWFIRFTYLFASRIARARPGQTTLLLIKLRRGLPKEFLYPSSRKAVIYLFDARVSCAKLILEV